MKNKKKRSAEEITQTRKKAKFDKVQRLPVFVPGRQIFMLIIRIIIVRP